MQSKIENSDNYTVITTSITMCHLFEKYGARHANATETCINNDQLQSRLLSLLNKLHQCNFGT